MGYALPNLPNFRAPLSEKSNDFLFWIIDDLDFRRLLGSESVEKFDVIEAGESLVKEQVCFSQLTTNGDYKLNIFDVEYLLNDLKEIKLSGTFECSERSVEHYRSRFTDPTGKKAEFWTGKIESPTITLAAGVPSIPMATN